MIGDLPIVDAYLDWLRASIKVEEVGTALEISTPFLDRHNDHVQIYARAENGQIRLSDDGFTRAEREHSGVELERGRRQDLLEMTLRGFAVQRSERGELFVTADRRDLGRKKHLLIQAILAVGDLFYTARETVASLFREDVEAFLTQHEVRFTPDISLIGRSGFPHRFDFVIPASGRAPERVVATLNRPTKQQVELRLFSFMDIRDVRPSDFQAMIFLNDEEGVPERALDALAQYRVEPLFWTRRRQYADRLRN